MLAGLTAATTLTGMTERIGVQKSATVSASVQVATVQVTTAQATTNPVASQGFTANAADGQVTLSGQGQWTPEDFYTGLPQALMNEYDAVTKGEHQDWQALTKDVAAGNLQTAQTDLASYEKLEPGGGGAVQDSALKALSAALATGDATSAATALTTATNSLSNSFINGGNSPMLLAQAANDALSTPNWLQDLTNFGGTLAPATMGQTQSGGDQFTQDLQAIQQDAQAGTAGLANFLESQGYSGALATADAQMTAYQWTAGSLSTVMHDVANETNSTATFEISHSLTSVGTVGGTDRAYSLSTDEKFSGNTGIKDTVTESELAMTATGAIATAAVVDFGPSRPPSATATVAVDSKQASDALSSLSGYQASFSVTETQSSLRAASVEVSTAEASASTTPANSRSEPASASRTPQGTTTVQASAEDAWAAVAVWSQKVDSYAAGNSSWSSQSADHTATAKIESSFESESHQSLELVAMVMGRNSASISNSSDSRQNPSDRAVSVWG